MGIYGAALRELEQYRRDEAAGLLLRLPVPLGATVWRVRDNPAAGSAPPPPRLWYGPHRKRTRPGKTAAPFLLPRRLATRPFWPCWMPGGRLYSPPRLRGGRC